MKTPIIEPLLFDDFIKTNNVTNKSRKSYLSYLTNIISTYQKNGVSLNDDVEDFLYTLPLCLYLSSNPQHYSQALKQKNDIINCLTSNSKLLNKNKLFIFNQYIKYINSINVSSIASLLNNKVTIYNQQALRTKFQSRINSWSRLSGDKIWFPLVFIQKLCNSQPKTSPRVHINYKNYVYDNLKLIIFDKGYKHVNVKDIDYIFETVNNKFYCAKGGKIYCVYTPSKYLNHKEIMVAEDLSCIDIDHVTPIDVTLRSLQKKLKNLDIISNIVKQTKNNNNSLTGKNLETQAFDYYQSMSPKPYINTKDLDNEIKSIAQDSHYRLAVSKTNMQKSNTVVYIKYYTDNNTYYGLIDDNVYYQGQKMCLYQDLGSLTMSVTNPSFFSSMKIVPEVKVPIDYL